MPGFPVNQLPDLAKTHVHWISDVTQPSHPLSRPSPAWSFASSESFQMSQFFATSGQSIEVSASASVLPMNIQAWFLLGWTGWISLQSKGLSRVFSNTTVQQHQFFDAQSSLWSNSHIHGTTNWFQIEKGVRQAVYYHPAYLTYMQSTSRETLGWKKHKLESRLPGEISITSDMQMTPPLWQKVKRN